MALRPGDDFDRDILDIIPERFDADADSRQARAGQRFRTSLTLVAAVLAVGGIVAAGWHFMGAGATARSGIPVIKADQRPVKVRPDDRGGMQVPNQDKLVYERLETAEGGEPKAERLLPAAEQPKAPPRAAAPVIQPPQAPSGPETLTKADEPPSPKSGEPPLPKAAPPTPVATQKLEPPAASPAPAAQQTAAAPVRAVPAAAAPTAKPVTPTIPPAQTATAKVPPAGDWLVQLGALRAPDAAEKEWKRIQRGHNDLLGSLRPNVLRVELGEKGTFWRLRAGPLTEQAARQLCQELTKRNQGCIVARK